MSNIDSSGASPKTRWFPIAIWAIIAFIIAKSLHQHWATILTSDYPDTDDALRLAQIRDWMAGQSWFDTTQTRINPPAGGDIHWSRLIDLPMAALIAMLTPFFGATMAERIMLAGYPLLLLSGLIWLMARTVRHHFGAMVATLACYMLPLSMAIAIQFAPLRIDHHGVQILLAGIALACALRTYVSGKPAVGMAIATGAILALYLSISFEALPYVVIFGGLWAWRLLRHPSHAAWQALAGYAVAFTLGSTLILAGTRGISALGRSYCDAMSLPWLAAATGASAVLLLIVALPKIPQSRIAILGILGVAAAGAAGAIALTSPACFAGPFASLDPLVRDYWYINVLEGRPVWEQTPDMWVYVWVPILLGCIGTAWAWYRAILETDWDAAQNWETIAVLLAGASLAAILVLRGGGVAQLFALPGAAWLIAHCWMAARRMKNPLKRIGSTLAIAAIAPPLCVPPLAAALEPASNVAEAKRGKANAACMARSHIAPLSTLAKATIFTPIDLGAQVIEATPHAVIATPHHRNQAAIKTVISGFMANPDDAANIVRNSGANMLIICPAANEVGNYAKDAPNSLAAHLMRGDTPDWLERMPTPAKNPIIVYRVNR